MVPTGWQTDMKPFTIRLLYGALALGIGVWLLQSGVFDSDERDIRRQLGQLRELLEKEAGEEAGVAEHKARRVGTLYTREFEFHLKDSRSHQVLTGRDELEKEYLGYYRGADAIDVVFRDQELAVDGTRRTAEMKLEAVVTSSWQGGGHKGRDLWNLELSWQEEDGEWLMRRCLIESLDSGAFPNLF